MLGSGSNAHQSPIRLGLPLAMAAAVLVLGACSGGQGGGTASTGNGATGSGAGGDICSAAQNQPAKPGAQLAVLVVDHTASARTDLAEPHNLNGAITELQKKGREDGKGSEIQTLTVTASGQFPKVGKALSLDLKPGDTSPNADSLRQRVVHDCIPGILKGDGAPAPSGETDVIGALLAANQQKPTQIFVVSSGLNSTAQANLTAPGYDPAQLADAVKTAIPEFGTWSVPVTWFDLGEPNPPLSAPDRDRLITFWKDLLGKYLTVDTRE